MEYRYLGRSGLQVSTLSLGSWVTFGKQMDVDVAYQCMTTAFEGGVNFFDNAEAYEHGAAETLMGHVLKRAGWGRDQVVISTKLFWGGRGPNQQGLSRKHILEGLDASLRRLQLDYVDVLFCHRPDLHTPVEETVRAMTHVINQGKVLYWGTSEWSAARIAEARAVAQREHLIAPVVEQPQYNMFCRERVEAEYAELYEAPGLGLTIWSPLASGLLTGKYNHGVPPDSRGALPGYEWLRSRLEGPEAQHRIAKVVSLAEVAKALGCTLPQLAIAWCAANPRVSTVIMGASRVEQLQSNLQSMAVLPKLTPDVLTRIEGILANAPEGPEDFRR